MRLPTSTPMTCPTRCEATHGEGGPSPAGARRLLCTGRVTASAAPNVVGMAFEGAKRLANARVDRRTGSPTVSTLGFRRGSGLCSKKQPVDHRRPGAGEAGRSSALGSGSCARSIPGAERCERSDRRAACRNAEPVTRETDLLDALIARDRKDIKGDEEVSLSGSASTSSAATASSTAPSGRAASRRRKAATATRPPIYDRLMTLFEERVNKNIRPRRYASTIALRRALRRDAPGFVKASSEMTRAIRATSTRSLP